MQIEFSVERNILVATPLDDQLDATIAGDFKKELLAGIGPHCQALVLDLAQVRFVDSTGLGVIMALPKALNGDRGAPGMAICNVGHDVRQLFNLTRMNRLIPLYASRTEAVDALRPKPVENIE